MAQFGATVGSLILGTVSLFLVAAIERLLWQGKHELRVIAAVGEVILVLFGGRAGGTVIGGRLTGEVLWPWLLVGEAVLFLPAAVFVAYRRLLGKHV